MVMVTSISLTLVIASIIFRHDEKRMFNHHTLENAVIIRNVINTFSKSIESLPVESGKKIIISNHPDLLVEYFHNIDELKKSSDFSGFSLEELIKTKDFQILDRNDRKSGIILFIKSGKTDSGIIYVEDFRMTGPPPAQRNRDDDFHPHLFHLSPEVIIGFGILLFLAILLIPYSQYSFRPLRELMTSINRVTTGDVNTLIDTSKKSDFNIIADAFNNMTMKINDMIKQRDRLVADVSHELRTPLTRIRLSLELLDKEDKGSKRHINKSINEIEQLDKLIDDLLDASKLQLSKKDFIFENISLKKVIEDNVDKNTLLFKEHDLEIKTDLPAQDIKIQGERQLLERALSNIFSNTAKYAPAGSKIDITLKKEDKFVILKIRDYGPGVREDELEKLFQPFYRSDDSRSRKTGGTGLGLSIVKQIINLHEGKILAEKPVEGTGLVIKIIFNTLN